MSNERNQENTGAQTEQQNVAVPQVGKKESNLKKMEENFKPIIVATALFAVFYTYCLYLNMVGITFPIFVTGCFIYANFCFKTLSISLKKDGKYYMIAAVLLGISTFMTDSVPIQVFNFLGFFLLLSSYMIHQVYDDTKWDFAKYWETICYSGLMMIAYVFYPFIHFSAYLKTKPKKSDSKTRYVVLGLLITIPLLCVVLLLLSSADAVFGNLFAHLFDWITVPAVVFRIVFLTIFAFFFAYAMICVAIDKVAKEECTVKHQFEPIIAITFNSALTIVYLVFCAIQISFLFIGGMDLPNGMTYAQYARSGYFQLLFVCIINLILVLFCIKRFREHKILNYILLIISCCTFIMIASSAYRMILYISAYRLTFLRVLVMWSLAVLTVLLVGIVITIFKKEFQLFRYCTIVVTLSYLLLSFSHQDYWIAHYNVNGQNTSQYDRYYLVDLSADAAPVIMKLYQSDQEEYPELRSYFYDLQEKSSTLNIRTFNLSRWLAGRTIEKSGLF